MPRSARIDIPNILQHVIVRGIEKRDIFSGDDDRHDFVTRFSNLLESEKKGTDLFSRKRGQIYFPAVAEKGTLRCQRQSDPEGT
jgi:hypothetical protein